jgi:hypothetical protein
MSYKSLKYLLAAMFLGACLAPENMTYRENFKPGATLNQIERIKINCEQRAIREVPAAYTQTQTRINRAPGSSQCEMRNGRWVCRDTGALVGANTAVLDANQSLRERVYLQCLNDNGILSYTARGCSMSEIQRFNSSNPNMGAYRIPQPTQNMCFLTSNYHGGRLMVTRLP